MPLGKSAHDPIDMMSALIVQTVLQSKALICFSNGEREKAYMFYLLDELATRVSFDEYCDTMFNAFPQFRSDGLNW